MKPCVTPTSPESALMLANAKVGYWSREAYNAQARIKILRRAMRETRKLLAEGKADEADRRLERALKPKRFKVIQLYSLPKLP